MHVFVYVFPWILCIFEVANMYKLMQDMLQQKHYRRLLAEFIVDNNIKTATASNRNLLRMFINWLVAI